MNRILLAVAAISFCAVSSWAALTPAQLTPQERTNYNRIASDPVAARHFLTTREYLRTCRATTPETAAKLPDIPTDYDGKYVTVLEQKAVDDALDMSFAALVRGVR